MAGQHSLTNIENTQNVKFIQHNCAKSTNAMISCLEYAVLNRVDIVYFRNHGREIKKQFPIRHSHVLCRK